MAAIECDNYGFFNGILALEQSNWANYWKGIIPDGVVSGQDDEMEVFAQSDGMKVHVKTGQTMVDNHRVWLTSAKEVEIAAADSSNPRIDLIVLRVVYGETGESMAYLDAITGTPAANPSAPALTQVTGGTYEVALASVLVGAGVTTIAADKVTDLRYVFKLGNDSVLSFSGTSLTVKNDIDHRSSVSSIGSLAITLPGNPNDTFITGVAFTSASSFSGITFTRNGSTYSPKLLGSALTLASKRYNLTIWWDGAYFWCNAEAA